MGRKETVRILCWLASLMMAGGIVFLVITGGGPDGILGVGLAVFGFMIWLGLIASNFGRFTAGPYEDVEPEKKKPEDVTWVDRVSLYWRVVGTLMIPAGIIICVIFADEQDAQSKPWLWGGSVYSTGMLVTVLGVFSWFFWLIYFIGGKGGGGGGGCSGGDGGGGGCGGGGE